MNTTIQVRVDVKTKQEVQKILKKAGLDISSAVKMFFAQIKNRKTLPLEFRTENGFTPAEERRILNDLEWTKKHGKRFTSVDEAFEYLNS